MKTKLCVLVALLVGSTGCATKIRNVTAQAWSPQGTYVGYWEGTCKPVLGCDAGDGKVLWCALDPQTNELACSEQPSVSVLLDRKAK